MPVSTTVLPHERLGRWTGSTWAPVSPGSITAERVHVFVHGWCRGLRPQVDEAGGYLDVWDERATTEEGSRYDRWFGPLADAILALDQDACILAYTWADEAATATSVLTGVLSQQRTTVNGQRLGRAISSVLSGEGHRLHFVGYSHGAKVATIAAGLAEPRPEHLTLLDSPDNSLPIIGGALNDLSIYLRSLHPTIDGSNTFVDNYVSEYGVRYGLEPGLGEVVDVVLDPERFPVDDIRHDHAYAWKWYLRSAQNPDAGVGFMWSPLAPGGALPEETEYAQGIPNTEDVDEDLDPLTITPHHHDRRGTSATDVAVRIRAGLYEPFILSTDDHTSRRGVYWRRPGEVAAVAGVTWIEGDERSFVRIVTDGVERARSVKGWDQNPDRTLVVPLGSARSGPMRVVVSLESDVPAKVEVQPATRSYVFKLPALAEIRAWYRVLAVSGLMTFVGVSVLAVLGVRRRRRRVRVVESAE